MPSLKDLKNRIESVKSTRKITKAMQMVAAAKLRRAQDAAEQARPYAERFDAVLAQLAQGVGDTGPRLLVGTGSEDVHLLVVMTSERGLAGGFNANIVKLARTRIRELQGDGKTVKIVTVGKKGRDQLRRDFRDLFVHHVDMTEVKRVGYEDAARIAKDILNRFDAGEFDVCTLFFSEFENVVTQKPTAQQIIPARFDAPEGETAAKLYDYEPGEEAILADLLPRGVATQVFAALLENAAGEQGARMSAMDNATRNAGDMIDRLTVEYNRTRQAAITTELIEIIAGAEAL
jgi:F-type H+-transporting ATPase subunit gamma